MSVNPSERREILKLKNRTLETEVNRLKEALGRAQDSEESWRSEATRCLETSASLRAQLAAVTAERDEWKASYERGRDGVTPMMGELLSERTTAIQGRDDALDELKRVTEERDGERARRAWASDLAKEVMKRLDLGVHLLAHQHARRLEEREAKEALRATLKSMWEPIYDMGGWGADGGSGIISALLNAIQQEQPMPDHRNRAALGGGTTEPSTAEALGCLLDEAGLHVYAHKPGCPMDGCSCRSESLGRAGK